MKNMTQKLPTVCLLRFNSSNLRKINEQLYRILTQRWQNHYWHHFILNFHTQLYEFHLTTLQLDDVNLMALMKNKGGDEQKISVACVRVRQMQYLVVKRERKLMKKVAHEQNQHRSTVDSIFPFLHHVLFTFSITIFL